MNRRSVDHYRTLGIPHNASEEEIKQAYRQEAKRWHPDVNDSEEAATRFHQATESFEALMGRERGRRGHWASSSAASVDEEHMAARIRQFRARAAGMHVPNEGRLPAFFRHFRRWPSVEPSLFVLLPVALGVTWLLVDKAEESRPKTNHGPKVKAWRNPRTNRWETPAPWDPLYAKHRNTLTLVPRSDVYASTPPSVATASPGEARDHWSEKRLWTDFAPARERPASEEGAQSSGGEPERKV